MSEEHPNCQAVDRFLAAIPSVSRPICRTQNLNEKPVADGYTAAWYDQASGSGFTIIAMNEGDMLLMVERKGEKHEIRPGKLADAEAFAAHVNEKLFTSK